VPFPNVATVLDSGTGTDASPIAGNWSGPIESGIGQLKRLSNQFASVANSFSHSYWNAAQFGPDVEVIVTIPTKSASGASCGVWGRIQNPGNTSTCAAYMVEVGSTGIDIYKLTAGHTYAQLGTRITQTITSGDSVGMSIHGTTIESWYKVGAGAWTMLDSQTDSAISGAGYVGLEIDHSDVRCTNFGAGTIVAAGTLRTLSMMGVGS
jgi:hypothetical protein